MTVQLVGFSDDSEYEWAKKVKESFEKDYQLKNNPRFSPLLGLHSNFSFATLQKNFAYLQMLHVRSPNPARIKKRTKRNGWNQIYSNKDLIRVTKFSTSSSVLASAITLMIGSVLDFLR